MLLGTAWHTVWNQDNNISEKNVGQHARRIPFDTRLTPRFPSESSFIVTAHLRILPWTYPPALLAISPYQAISISCLKRRFQCLTLGAHFEEAERDLKLQSPLLLLVWSLKRMTDKRKHAINTTVYNLSFNFCRDWGQGKKASLYSMLNWYSFILR